MEQSPIVILVLVAINFIVSLRSLFSPCGSRIKKHTGYNALYILIMTNDVIDFGVSKIDQSFSL